MSSFIGCISSLVYNSFIKNVGPPLGLINYKKERNTRTTSKLQSASKQGAMRVQRIICNLLPRNAQFAYEHVAICFQAMRSALTSKLQSASKQGEYAYFEQVAICFQAMCNVQCANYEQFAASKQCAVRLQASCILLPSNVQQVAICFQVDSAFVNPGFFSRTQAIWNFRQGRCNITYILLMIFVIFLFLF
jgi:hypothetical protein